MTFSSSHVSLVLAIAVVSGCGGNDALRLDDAGPDEPEVSDAAQFDGTVPDGNAPADATVIDTALPTDAANEADDADAGGMENATTDGSFASEAAADASLDAPGDECSAAGEPCTYAGTRALCNASLACAPCVDPTGDAGGNDDYVCASAYGGAQICIGGVCTPGECRVPIDCLVPTGLPYCGAHFCGTCIHDDQCPGPAPFCDYTAPDGGMGGGRCVPSARLTACVDAGDNTPCPDNPGDVCCGGACLPGNCCSAQGGTAFCQATQGPSLSCASGICTTCPPSNGTDFYVDPVNGDDTRGTGSLATGDAGGPAACALKTISRALTLIPVSAAPGTRIIVLGPATVGDAETFPLRLRSNIVLTTQGGAVALNVPSASLATLAVQLVGPGAGIQGGAGAPLTLSGNSTFDYGTLPDTGVGVAPGTDDTTFLENVTLQNFFASGIEVGARGVLTIRQGVVSTGAQQDGMVVEGRATVVVPAGQVPTSFSSNAIYIPFTGAPRVSGTGIVVTAGGAIDLHGVPGSAAGTGTVITNNNEETGLSFYRSAAATAPPNVVDGLVSYGNGPTGSDVPLDWSAGVLVYGGTNVKVRNSVLLGNVFSGIALVPTDPLVADGGVPNDDIGRVDLGTTAIVDGGNDWGRNVLQAVADAGQNQQAGICLALDPASGVLTAAGNTFSGRDCSGAAPAAITVSRGACVGGVDVGFQTYVAPDAAPYDSGTGYAGNDIDVSNCVK